LSSAAVNSIVNHIHREHRMKAPRVVLVVTAILAVTACASEPTTLTETQSGPAQIVARIDSLHEDSTGYYSLFVRFTNAGTSDAIELRGIAVQRQTADGWAGIDAGASALIAGGPELKTGRSVELASASVLLEPGDSVRVVPVSAIVPFASPRSVIAVEPESFRAGTPSASVVVPLN
jgi:hypothetical protein